MIREDNNIAQRVCSFCFTVESDKNWVRALENTTCEWFPEDPPELEFICEECLNNDKRND